MRSGTSGRNLAFSGDGRWTHRSSLECAGSADFPHPASAFRCSKAAGAAKEGKKRGFLSCFNPASPVASLAQGGLMLIHQIEVSYPLVNDIKLLLGKMGEFYSRALVAQVKLLSQVLLPFTF
jgi:hypothetical protein